MKPQKKKMKYPLDSKLDCRKRRADRHAKQVNQEQQVIREAQQESSHAWH